MQSRRKHILFWSAALVGPSGLLILLLEVALRLGAEAPSQRPTKPLLESSEQREVHVVTDGNLMGLVRRSTIPGLVYELKPNRRWHFMGADVKTNSDGFRGGAFKSRRQNVFRIVGIGDSVMFGWGVEHPSTYLELLRRTLADHFGSDSIEVLNGAVPGYNVEQEAVLLDKRYADWSPDMIIVGYTINDGDRALFEESPGQSLLARHSRLYSLGYDLLNARLRRPSLAAESRMRIRRGLEHIASSARRGPTPVLFLIYPQRLPQYDESMPRALSAELAFHYVDLYEAFAKEYRRRGLRGIEDFYLAPTDAHPNSEGHDLIASTVADAVVHYINGRQNAARDRP